MKGFYETPELEILEFLVDDIVTASSLINGGTGDGGDIDDGEFKDEDGTDPAFIYR